ncbi:hypothetical protein EKO27_g8271 [Xylaria grammica]|uniref:Uncharacterized protein n=1 Tax=Xylaria grammica TaxID=363999 RepID=A0A439CXA8_9PEZI|nr:hypothetical protein EKO27_g8271 [Xylaria grammica]
MPVIRISTVARTYSRYKDVLSPIGENGGPGKDIKSLAICGPGGIHAGDATVLADESGRVAQILGLVLEGTADTRDPVVTHETAKGWLANPTRLYDKANNRLEDEAAWIPAFGNVSDPDILSDDLPPNGSNGSIRITSRDILAKTPLYRVRVGINPPPMIEQEASNRF